MLGVPSCRRTTTRRGRYGRYIIMVAGDAGMAKDITFTITLQQSRILKRTQNIKGTSNYHLLHPHHPRSMAI